MLGQIPVFMVCVMSHIENIHVLNMTQHFCRRGHALSSKSVQASEVSFLQAEVDLLILKRAKAGLKRHDLTREAHAVHDKCGALSALEILYLRRQPKLTAVFVKQRQKSFFSPVGSF